MWVYGHDWAGPGQRQVADASECGNEPSGSVKCGEFLDQLLLKKDSAPWSKYVYLAATGRAIHTSTKRFLFYTDMWHQQD